MWIWVIVCAIIIIAIAAAQRSANVTARESVKHSVQTLDISHSNASNETVKIISQNVEIRKLNLSYNRNITEVWPLKQCSKLCYLDIQYTGVEWCPATLVHCPDLRWLNVSGTKVHSETLHDIRQACPGIHIICDDCVNLSV